MWRLKWKGEFNAMSLFFWEVSESFDGQTMENERYLNVGHAAEYAISIVR